jgi:hypothetical protein
MILLAMLISKVIKRNYIPSVLIIVGAAFNLGERLVNGYVLDYIPITWGYINIADIILWVGLLLLNYEIWFNDNDLDEKSTTKIKKERTKLTKEEQRINDSLLSKKADKPTTETITEVINEPILPKESITPAPTKAKRNNTIGSVAEQVKASQAKALIAKLNMEKLIPEPENIDTQTIANTPRIKVI